MLALFLVKPIAVRKPCAGVRILCHNVLSGISIKFKVSFLYVAKPKISRFVFSGPDPRKSIWIMVLVTSKPLDIINKHTHGAVTDTLGVCPGEADVISLNERLLNLWYWSIERFEELCRNLENAVKSPTSNAIDEEAGKKALVNQTGPGLKCCSWEKDESQDIMMDPKIHIRYQPQYSNKTPKAI